MGKDMRPYIDRQGAEMLRALELAEETCAPFVRAWQAAAPDRLYLVGSGTSGNAARAAAPGMEQWLGVEVTAVSPTSMPMILRGKPFFVFISQGGQSTNTVRAIEQLGSAYPCVALTGEEVCRINSLLPHVVLTCGHEAAGPKTMGYTCTILTLYLMALAVSPLSSAEKEEAWNALRRMADSMGENIAATEAWLEKNLESLLTTGNWAIAGIGAGREVAKEAALKLQETLLCPAQGFEYEEYLHGPTMMLGADAKAMGGMYLLPPEGYPDRARMEALAAFHAGFGSPVVCVRSGEKAEAEGHTLTMRAGEEEYLEPFWQILLSQLMGAHLPERLGVEGLGHGIFVQIDEAVGVKCREKA